MELRTKITYLLLSAGCCLTPLASGAAEAPAALEQVLDRAAEAPAADGAAEEVSPKDWSYQAIEDLASRGLVHGYKDAKFLDGRTLSRYELATLLKRVIQSLLLVPVPADDRALVPETPGTAAARGQGLDQPPLGRPIAAGATVRDASFRESDLGVIRRLTDAYSVELAVIGVNLQDTVARIGALEGRIEAVEKALKDPKGPLQTAISNIARIDKIRFSGYVQARYESFENTRESDPSDSRQAVTDRFTLRRVRLVANARPTPNTSFKYQIDLAPSTLETRDAWVDYFFSGNPAKGYTATIGQFKVPFGFEVIQSSGVREAPERARVVRFFYPSERDRGIKLASPTGNRWFWEISAYNGIVGPGRAGINANDNNNNKNIAGRIRTTQLGGDLDAGISFDFGNSLRTALYTSENPRPGGGPSAANPYENTRKTLGFDFQYHGIKNTELRGEFVWGKAAGTYATGYILQAIHNINPKYQAVVKYDWLGLNDLVAAPLGAGGTPIGDAVAYEGTLSNLSLGVIRFLDKSTRLKLFYEIHGHGRETLSYVPLPWQGNVMRFEWISNF